MKVDGKNCQGIWWETQTPDMVKIIDQRLLPHEFVVVDLKTVDDAIRAIKDMYVRGAPLIGATGAFGVFLILINQGSEKDPAEYLKTECARLRESRPTAVNLAWAVDLVMEAVLAVPDPSGWKDTALKLAREITDQEVENCRRIGRHGSTLIEEMSKKKGGEPVNILTHCNAGWLACVDIGTATAPIYTAHEKGIPVHVWVDETRPLNQGARLTAWEMLKQGVPHTLITDNAGGHLMQHGQVDMVIVGTDRTTHTGDVANKIGTYLKALAAKDNNIPFYVALPSSTIDWVLFDGIGQIPIELRDPDEVRLIPGLCQGEIQSVLVPPEKTPVANHAFDVTPARLVTGLITERGLCKASQEDIARLFPEKTTDQNS